MAGDSVVRTVEFGPWNAGRGNNICNVREAHCISDFSIDTMNFMV